jgi:DNA repair exonuclease SbcCD ATPase subunit
MEPGILCESHNERIGRVEDLSLRLASLQSQLQADYRAIKESLVRIESKLDANIARVEKIEDGLDRCVARVDILETKIKAVERTTWGAVVAVLGAGLALAQSWLRSRLGW